MGVFYAFLGRLRSRYHSGMRRRDLLLNARELLINLGQLGRDFSIQLVDPARKCPFQKLLSPVNRL
jgi:hypothetical protein